MSTTNVDDLTLEEFAKMHGVDEDGIPHNAEQILKEEYAKAQEEFDIVYYILGAIIFLIVLKFTN